MLLVYKFLLVLVLIQQYLQICLHPWASSTCSRFATVRMDAHGKNVKTLLQQKSLVVCLRVTTPPHRKQASQCEAVMLSLYVPVVVK